MIHQSKVAIKTNPSHRDWVNLNASDKSSRALEFVTSYRRRRQTYRKIADLSNWKDIFRIKGDVSEDGKSVIVQSNTKNMVRNNRKSFKLEADRNISLKETCSSFDRFPRCPHCGVSARNHCGVHVLL
jgi:hypothetical protein